MAQALASRKARNSAFWTLRRILASIGIAVALMVTAGFLWFAETYRAFVASQAQENASQTLEFMVSERLFVRYRERFAGGIDALARNPALVRAVETGGAHSLQTAADDVLSRLRESAFGVSSFPMLREPMEVYSVTLLSRGLQPLVTAKRGEALTAARRPEVAHALSQRPKSSQRRLSSVLWQTGDGRSVHSFIAPIGGFRVLGFVEIVSDPRTALKGLASALGGGIEMRDGRGKMVFSEQDPISEAEDDRALDRLELDYPATHGGLWASLIFTRDIGAFLQEVRRLTNRVLAIGAIVLIGGGAIAFLLVGFSVFSKLRTFSSAMLAISEGRTDVVLPPVGRDEMGTMAGALSVLREAVVERNEAEQALRESEERLHTVLDHMPANVFFRDPEGRFVFINTSYEDSYNFTLEAAHGKTLHDLYSLDIADEYACHDREVIDKDQVVERELTINLDGEERIFSAVNFPIHDLAGTVVGVGGVEVDVTERKRTEEALRESEALLRLSLDNMTDGIYVLDSELRYLTFNDRFHELLGVSYEEIQVGKPVRDVVSRLAHDGFYGPGDPKMLADERMALIASEEYVEIEFTTKSDRIIQSRMSPLDDGGAVITLTDITERKKAEDAVRESEQRLRSLIDNSPSEIVIKDTDLRYVQVNRVFEQNYGVSRADIVGKRVRDILPKSMADAIEVQDAEVMKSGVPLQMELDALVHGEPRVNLESKFPIPDAQGNVIGIAGIATDITERKRAEEMLRRQALIMEQMSEGVILTDLDGLIIDWNRGAEKMFGYAKEEAVGRTVDFLDAPGIGGAQRAEIDDTLERHDRWEGEHRFVRKDGTRGVSEVVIVPYRDELGALVAHVGVNHDVTERRKAEVAIRESETRLRAIIDNTPASVFLKDTEGRYLLTNKAIAERQGFSLTEILGKTAYDHFPKAVADSIADHEQEVIRTKDTIVRELEVPLPDGDRYIGLAVKFPVLGSDGEISAVGTITSNITDRKHAEEEIERARDQAEAANEAKSELVAMVSHEVRTPMNGVLGMARLLRNTPLDENQRNSVETIVTSGESLLRIIDDLLDISKLEAGKLELESIPFVPTDVVSRSIAVMASRAEEKGLAMSSEVDPALSTVLVGDPHRLQQVLLNLISNAIKFTHEGSVTVEAKMDSQEDDKAVVAFAVADTGQGIKPENQEKLFADYTQASVDVARKYGGTGLGLAICRRLVDLMDGEIRLDSAVGEGSTFRFDGVFGVDRTADIAELRKEAATRTGTAAETAGRPLLVLQAEDNAVNRDVAEKILTGAGHRVVSVENGIEALSALEGGEFDAVLMDRHMPEMSGLEATRRIRDMDEPLASIPIIGITASAIQSELDACIEAGMDECLTKPVDAELLLATLSRLSAWKAVGSERPILVIDDALVNRMVAGEQLKELGIPCELAESAADGLALVDDGNYGAILVDINMPDMDGLEFTRRFRQREEATGRRTPVLAMTGDAEPEDREKFLAAGMDDVLVKPVTAEQLSAVLSHWLNGEGARGMDNASSAEGGDMATTVDHPPVDLERFCKILGKTDEAEVLPLLESFVAQFPELLKALEDAVAERQTKPVRAAAHAAKGVAANTAAGPLREILAHMEKNAESEDWDDLDASTAVVKDEFERIAAFFRDRSAKG